MSPVSKYEIKGEIILGKATVKRNEWILAKARLLPNAHASKLTMLMGKRTHHICGEATKSGRIHLIVAKKIEQPQKRLLYFWRR